jgi:hypothetical protein
LRADPCSQERSDDSLSDGVALKLLPLPGATLLTILGPNNLGFRSSLATAAMPIPFPFPFPFPMLDSDDVDRFASETEFSGFNVSSELRGEFASG